MGKAVIHDIEDLCGSHDGRPRIYLAQVLIGGAAYGWWGRKPRGVAVGRTALTVPLALQDALASIDYQPAVILWCGREQAL